MKRILLAVFIILSACSSIAEMMLLEVKEKREIVDEKFWTLEIILKSALDKMY